MGFLVFKSVLNTQSSVALKYSLCWTQQVKEKTLGLRIDLYAPISNSAMTLICLEYLLERMVTGARGIRRVRWVDGLSL